ncbi:hypothetical protein ACHAWO_011212 [Cyclotella atomus]|uniref:Uncharacterized protein n=1 Tax=Cyclotella atomus TaxID=382360 RepID=A0ABD3NVM3_9STRA
MKFTTAVDNGYSPPRDMKNVQFAGIRRMNSSHKSSSTQLRMADRNALIPDGGLSPCVIKALMGIGIGSGKTGAEDAATAAISSPCSILPLTMLKEDANVIFEALIDESLEDSISITVLATGFATTPKQNLSNFNDVQQMSRRKNTEPVYDDEEEYEDDKDNSDDESDDGDDRIPSFLLEAWNEGDRIPP